MFIINQSKKIIDGIKPMQTIDLSKEKADKLLGMYGKEIKVVIDEVKLSKKINELEDENGNLIKEIAILNARYDYLLIMSKEVPVNKKNDIEWMKNGESKQEN